MMKQELQTIINGMSSEKVNELVAFMTSKGFDVSSWMEVEKADYTAVKTLEEYFGSEISVDGNLAEKDNVPQPDMDKIKKAGRKTASNKKNNKTKKEDEEMAKKKTVEEKEIVKESESIDKPIERQIEIKSDETENKQSEQETEPEVKDEIKAPEQDNKDEGTPPADDNNNEEKKIISIEDKKKEMEDKNKEDKSKEDKGKKETAKTQGSILKEYKTVDNLVDESDVKETKIHEVTELIEDRTYGAYITGTELVAMFLGGKLVYDPQIQRGAKEDKNGILRAVFKESHVRDIYNSIKDGEFTPTQMQFAIISDEPETSYEFNYDKSILNVKGRIRLVDGQHRLRSLVRIQSELKFNKIEDIDLDDLKFNVQIHVCTADEARIIYQNIDKNLKLDKSQSRQLSADPYARVVDMLNKSPESDLRGKIATCKPVGNKLVLFSTLAEELENVTKINNMSQRNMTLQYLTQFFNYVAEKLPSAFDPDEKVRGAFKKDNLLAENNFFPTWIRLAYADITNYQKNIDKIAENVDYFNKTKQNENGEYIWLKANALKYRENGKEGFAMQNTGTGITNLTKMTFELLGMVYKDKKELKKEEDERKKKEAELKKQEDLEKKEGDGNGDDATKTE